MSLACPTADADFISAECDSEFFDQQQQPSKGAFASIAQLLQFAVEHKKLFPGALDIYHFSHKQELHQHFYSVQTGAGNFSIKCQPTTYLAQTEAEAQGLLHIANSDTLATFIPIARGTLGDCAFLICQYQGLAIHGDWFSAGQQLAQMHQQRSATGFGFNCPTFNTGIEQNNDWSDNWCDFFMQQRLQPLLQKLNKQGLFFTQQKAVLEVCADILNNHRPQASLLHGNLWSGNIGFNPERDLPFPVIYNPASFYGDSEFDLATSELFGRFPKRFYLGYESVTPISPEYSQRSEIYQLFHLLNHALALNHHYIAQAQQQINDILSAHSRQA